MTKQVLDVDDAVNIVIRLCKAGVALNKDSLREELGREAYTLGSDFAPQLKHSHWTNLRVGVNGNGSANCFRCGCTVHNNFTESVINYCPNCGSVMDR